MGGCKRWWADIMAKISSQFLPFDARLLAPLLPAPYPTAPAPAPVRPPYERVYTLEALAMLYSYCSLACSLAPAPVSALGQIQFNLDTDDDDDDARDVDDDDAAPVSAPDAC